MACCEAIPYVQKSRYGVINAMVHAPACPYAPGHPWRYDLTPQDKPTLPESVKPSEAMRHWMDASPGCDCAMCLYVDAHLDDDDDRRESIVDTSDDPVVQT